MTSLTAVLRGRPPEGAPELPLWTRGDLNTFFGFFGLLALVAIVVGVVRFWRALSTGDAW